jgi:photosystem II stability/assembly factor-like uncharacterized protein
MKKLLALIILISLSFTTVMGQWNQVYHQAIGDILYDVEFADEENALAVGEGWYFYISDNGGESWSPLSLVPGIYMEIIFTTDGNAVLMERGGSFWSFNIYSHDIESLIWPEDPYELKTMELIDDSACIAGGYDGIYLFDFTGDIDTLWSFQSLGQIIGGDINSICRINDTVLYAFGYYYVSYEGIGILLKSYDNGDTWDIIIQDSELGGNLYAQSEDVLFIAGGGIYKSINGGLDWVEKTCDPDTALSFREIYFNDLNNGYAVGGLSMIPEYKTTKIYKTIDGGENWYMQYYSNTGVLLSLCFLNDSIGLACGDDNTIVRTTNGGGVNVGLTSYTEESSLIEVYPNPAHAEIYCRLQIANCRSELLIYDMFGWKQEEIQIPAGQDQVSIDVSDYPAGIYIVVAKDEESILGRSKFVVR